MLKYKISVDCFAVLAIAATIVGCYYTTVGSPSIWLTIFVYIMAAIEFIGDALIIWYVSSTKDDDGGDGT